MIALSEKERIMKALESEIHRAEYTETDYLDCVEVKDLKLALELIKDLQEENASLEAEVDKQYEQAKADILGNMSDGGTSCHWCIEQHRANAVKEFAEKLKEIYQDRKFVNIRNVNARRFNEYVDYCIDVLNNLVKEWRNNNR